MFIEELVNGKRGETFLPDTGGRRYETIRRNLTNGQIMNALIRISDSEKFEIGEFHHIFLKDTNTIVGYIGNESLELYCSERLNSEKYRIPHKNLRRIFRAC